MTRPSPPARHVLRGATTLAMLAIAVSVGTEAQVTPGGRNTESRRDVDVTKLQVRGGIQLSAEQLALAGTVRPVDFKVLEAKLPDAVGSYRRVSKNGFTRSFGPMSVTIVKSVYESGDDRVELEILDPGGMPVDGDKALPMLPDGLEAPGDTVSFLGRSSGPYEGTIKSDRRQDRATYQVRVGPRVRVTATSSLSLAPALGEIVAGLDLDALAALAPEVPPELTPEDGE